MKRAKITGQDGPYRAERPFFKGYKVHGLVRSSPSFNTARLDHLHVDPHVPNTGLFLHFGDMSNGVRIAALLTRIQHEEVHTSAARTHPRIRFAVHEYTGDTTGVGATRLNEDSRFYPRRPHGAAKPRSYLFPELRQT